MSKKVCDLIKNAKTIVFDFDGTLVDSNSIKFRAFEECFKEYTKDLERIMDYCLKNHHTPRQVKFRTVFEEILGVVYTQEMEEKILYQFDQETTEKIILAPEISGATHFLKKIAPCFETALLSSTPHDKLLYILEKRKLKDYFQTVQGAPVDKASWFKHFMKQGVRNPQAVLFFGDTLEDALAAEQAGCAFVAVGSGIGKRRIRSFTEIHI